MTKIHREFHLTIENKILTNEINHFIVAEANEKSHRSPGRNCGHAYPANFVGHPIWSWNAQHDEYISGKQ